MRSKSRSILSYSSVESTCTCRILSSTRRGSPGSTDRRVFSSLCSWSRPNVTGKPWFISLSASCRDTPLSRSSFNSPGSTRISFARAAIRASSLISRGCPKAVMNLPVDSSKRRKPPINSAVLSLISGTSNGIGVRSTDRRADSSTAIWSCPNLTGNPSDCSLAASEIVRGRESTTFNS